MSQSIEVSDRTYSAIEAAATAEGTTPERWLDVHLAELTPVPQSTEAVGDAGVVELPQLEPFAGDATAPRSLYDLIKHRVGNVSFDYTDLAEHHSEDLASSSRGEVSHEVLTERFRSLVQRAECLGGDLSVRHSESFAEGMLEKRRMGSL